MRQAVARILKAEDASSYAPAYLEGLRAMLSQPEFANRDMLGFRGSWTRRACRASCPFHQAAPAAWL